MGFSPQSCLSWDNWLTPEAPLGWSCLQVLPSPVLSAAFSKLASVSGNFPSCQTSPLLGGNCLPVRKPAIWFQMSCLFKEMSWLLKKGRPPLSAPQRLCSPSWWVQPSSLISIRDKPQGAAMGLVRMMFSLSIYRDTLSAVTGVLEASSSNDAKSSEFASFFVTL